MCLLGEKPQPLLVSPGFSFFSVSLSYCDFLSVNLSDVVGGLGGGGDGGWGGL